VDELEAILAKDEDVASWSTYIGQGAIRFYLPLDVQLPNPFFSQLVIVARDVAARERLQARLEALLAEEFPHAVTRVSPLELGPPVGWPVQYRVSGPDPTRCATSRWRSPRSWRPTRTCCASTTTGWSPPGWCAS